METKKAPKADLSKNSSLYFVIGLCLVLFFSWQAIEWKTYKKTFDYEELDVDDEEDEEIPITEQIKTPPPPPASQVIEVVEDEEEVEETVIESTETDEDEIIEVEDVETEDEDLDVDVPFAVIEDVPIFPGR